jgi:hypothetical protein
MSTDWQASTEKSSHIVFLPFQLKKWIPEFLSSTLTISLLSLSYIVDDFLFQGPFSVGFRVWIELVLLALKKQHKASLTHS